MLETAEIGRKLEKDAYEVLVPDLRTALLKAQTAVEAARFPVIVLLNGMNAAGKGEMLNVLYEWLDARYLTTFVESPPTEEELRAAAVLALLDGAAPSGRIGLLPQQLVHAADPRARSRQDRRGGARARASAHLDLREGAHRRRRAHR